MSISFVLALAGTFSPVASAQDESRPTTVVQFYGHVFGHGLDGPMPSNTQFPTGEDNYGLGSTDFCTPFGGLNGDGDVPTPDPAWTCDKDPNNKLVLYSTAGFVQVSSGSEFQGAGGYAQLHNERGSAKDVVLDSANSILARLFMSVDSHSWFVNQGETYCIYDNPRDTGCLYPYWGWDPGFTPGYQVKACLYFAVLGAYGGAASDQPPIRQAIEGGQATEVACGATAPADVMNGLPGQPNVHAFDINLGSPKVTTIPKEANFFLVYSFNNNVGGQEFSPNEWRIWSGEFFPPSYSMPVKNAFDVELVVPQFIYGKLAILGLISTPWGSYDVNPDSTKLTITDERGNEVSPQRIEALADYKVAHGAHYKPVNITFVWDYVADRLAPGTYGVTISAKNHQGSASAQCTAKFTITAARAPGSIEVGQCGQQTDESHRNAQGDETNLATAPTFALKTVALQGASAVPVAGAPALALAFVALLFVARRWTK